MSWLSEIPHFHQNQLRRLDDLWRGFDYRMTTFPTSSDCEYVEGKDGELTIYLRAPGYARDDLTVEVQDGVLRVHGKIPEDRRATRLVQQQFDYDFSLNGGYQVEDASHENGVLAIRLSRVKKPESTKIPILSRDR